MLTEERTDIVTLNLLLPMHLLGPMSTAIEALAWCAVLHR